MDDVFQSKFAHDIFRQKYSMNGTETWADTCKRVVDNVCGNVVSNADKQTIYELMFNRQFIPGGRYLYASGRPLHQVQNCLMLRADDSREGWADLMYKSTMALMTGAGIGVDYSAVRAEGTPITRTGGKATGPLALMEMVNSAGRGIMQGGARRSAIWAGLKWDHPDVQKFINVKNWPDDIRKMKSKDYNAVAPMDGTNISVILDKRFFDAYDTRSDAAINTYNAVVNQMVSTAEPGFSVDYDNANESLRNACQPASAPLLTPTGIKLLGDINEGDTVWTGSNWTKVIKKWSTGVKDVYRIETSAGSFTGTDNHRIIQQGERCEVKDADSIDVATGLVPNALSLDIHDIMDGLVLGDGSVHKASNNLVYLFIGAKDQDYFNSEIGDLILKHRPGLSSNAYLVKTTITNDELPKTFNRTVPDRFYYGSNEKKAAFLRGLFTANGCLAGGRVSLKQTSKKLITQVQEMLSSLGIPSYIITNKSRVNKFSNGDYVMKESYDLNVTSGRTDFKRLIGFIQHYKQNAIRDGHTSKHNYNITRREYLGTEEVFEITVEDASHTYWTGGCLVSNCTELTSEDDSDICNIGSLNLARFNTLEAFKRGVRLATTFLLAGTLYSDIPYPRVGYVRGKNRRLGLGIMGVHEWLLKRGKAYDADAELQTWLESYAEQSKSTASLTANQWSISEPVKTRAIAPTGSIGIIGETSTGIEPIFCVAYRRRYKGPDGQSTQYQYVIDPVAKRLIDSGIKPDLIEDAYTLANDVERRVKFQSWVQKYVDHGISSTINLPSWGSPENNESTVKAFGDMLYKHLPQLRGITCYPDGCRDGQPLTRVSYETAIKHEGQVFVEQADSCDFTGKGGTCGA